MAQNDFPLCEIIFMTLFCLFSFSSLQGRFSVSPQNIPTCSMSTVCVQCSSWFLWRWNQLTGHFPAGRVSRSPLNKHLGFDGTNGGCFMRLCFQRTRRKASQSRCVRMTSSHPASVHQVQRCICSVSPGLQHSVEQTEHMWSFKTALICTIWRSYTRESPRSSWQVRWSRAADLSFRNNPRSEAQDRSGDLWIKDYPPHTEKHRIMLLFCCVHCCRSGTGAKPAERWYTAESEGLWSVLTGRRWTDVWKRKKWRRGGVWLDRTGRQAAFRRGRLVVLFGSERRVR